MAPQWRPIEDNANNAAFGKEISTSRPHRLAVAKILVDVSDSCCQTRQCRSMKQNLSSRCVPFYEPVVLPEAAESWYLCQLVTRRIHVEHAPANVPATELSINQWTKLERSFRCARCGLMDAQVAFHFADGSLLTVIVFFDAANKAPFRNSHLHVG